MNKKMGNRNLILIIIVLIIIGSINAMAMNKGLWFQKNENVDVYNYPVSPLATPDKWREMESYEEMVASTQIPDDVLINISTIGLIETCFDYPLFGNIYAYNSYTEGLDALNAQFNGFQSLYERNDIASEIVTFYENIDYKSALESNDPYHTIRVQFIDYFIAQDKILFSLSKEQRKNLLAVTSKVISEKKQMDIEKLPIDSTLYLAAKIMIIDDSNFEIELYKTEEECQAYFERGRINSKMADTIISKLTEGGY